MSETVLMRGKVLCFMKEQDATVILHDVIELLILALSELDGVRNEPSTQFAYGERVAYVECLEWIAQWKQAPQHGLDFDVEKRFPI